MNKIDNSSLIPIYIGDEAVTLEPAEMFGVPMTPDWTKSLIMLEVHVETATPEGTFKSAIKVLEHCAEMGINGIWLTPIYEKGEGGNGYGNVGLHTVEPALTETSDQEKGWEIVKWFVDEAHKRNIRIILDIITWGTVTASSLFANHPDWYSGTAWGGQAFNWTNEEFREWFISTAVENIIKTGADGYRCDCEPGYTGYTVFNQIRKRLLDVGRKVLIIAEDGCERKDNYDFEQDGVLDYTNWSRGEQYQTPKKFYIDQLNIVDSIKQGSGLGMNQLQNTNDGGNYRYYTFCVSNHDYQYSIVNRNRLVLGYQAILAPFIPLWYFGEEFNLQAYKQVFYFVPVDWTLFADADNKMFFEDIKKYIKIRLTYPEIFTYYPENHKDSNICKVNAEGSSLQAYARFASNKGIIVVPNNDSQDYITFKINIPFDDMNLTLYTTFTLTDLMNDKIITSGTKEQIATFTAEVKFEHIGVYLIEETV